MSKIKRIQLPKSQPVLYSDGVVFGNVLLISGMLPTGGDGQLVGKGVKRCTYYGRLKAIVRNPFNEKYRPE